MRILHPVKGYKWLYLEGIQTLLSLSHLMLFSLKALLVVKGKNIYSHLHYSEGSDTKYLSKDPFTCIHLPF